MQLFRQQSFSDLSAFVRHYWYFELGPDEVPHTQHYFPYGSFELIYYRDYCPLMLTDGSKKMQRQPQFTYSGQFTKPFTLHFEKPCRCYGISFFPWTGNLPYDIPADKFSNAIVEIADLDREQQLMNSLNRSTDRREIFRLMENYLRHRLNNQRIDEVSKHLAQQIIGNGFNVGKEKMLESVGLSRRRVEQKFLQSVGLTMGHFARKIRFQKATQLLRRADAGTSLTAVGLKAGYYDQSHFISEFREFSGVTPGVFRNQENELRNFFKSLVMNSEKN